MSQLVNCSGCKSPFEIQDNRRNALIKCPTCGKWCKIRRLQQAEKQTRKNASVENKNTEAERTKDSQDLFENHIKHFHSTRSGESLEPVIRDYGKITLCPDQQQNFLKALRLLFFTKRYEEHSQMLVRAYMSESEIIERKSFYLAYAEMLERHVGIAPNLMDVSMLQYLPEDMIDGGDPELVVAGKRMQATFAKIKEQLKKPDQPSEFGEMPQISEEKWQEYQHAPLIFFTDHIEQNWRVKRDSSRELNFASEVLRMDIEDIQEIFSEELLYENFFCQMAQTIANEMMESNQEAYAIRICDLFFPISGRASEILLMKKAEILAKMGRTEEAAAISKGLDLDLAPIPDNLELANISKIWEENGAEEALKFGIERFKLTPDDFAVCGLLAEIYLTKLQLDIALPIICRSYHRAPDNPVVLFHMARIFHAGYFPEQTDLCMARVRQTSAYQNDQRTFTLPVELFVKCDTEDTTAFFNGQPIGKCPVRFLVYPGQQSLAWEINGQIAKEISVDLKEATISKFRFHPADNSISDEISRTGCMTMFTAEGSVRLEDMVQDYLIDDLSKLPNLEPEAIMELIEKRL